MSGFTKLFSTIVTSSIWHEGHQTRIVWITMLALANREGVVEASVVGLADMARVTIEECELALELFSNPDKYSRTKDNEGRRIKAVDGGWQLLNHSKYRERLSKDDRNEYKRIKQVEYRKRKKSRKVERIEGSGGETAYVRAVERGASPEELDDIVTRHLPEELQEQTVQYQATAVTHSVLP